MSRFPSSHDLEFDRREREADKIERQITRALETLMECPFCGCLELSIQSGTVRRDDGYRVICCECQSIGGEGEDPDDAAAAWNKRETQTRRFLKIHPTLPERPDFEPAKQSAAA